MNPEVEKSGELDNYVSPEQIEAIEEHFFQQASKEYPGFAELNEGGLEHFRDKALLPAGEVGRHSIDEVDHVARSLITNFDLRALQDNFLDSPMLLKRYLRERSVVEQFLPQADALREARKYGPLFVLGNHPTIATPAYHMRSTIEVFGEESIPDTHVVIGPFPVAIKFGDIVPLDLLNSMGNVMVTGPATAGARKGRSEVSAAMKIFARRFKTSFGEVVATEPDDGEEYPIIHIMSGGTRDKPLVREKPYKRSVNPGNSATADLLIHPGASYAVVGTDDTLFDPHKGGDIRSPVARKMRVFHVEQNPEPESQRFGKDRDLLIFDMENELADPIALSRIETMRFFEKTSVRLANAASEQCGSRTRYYFGGRPKRT